MKVTKKDLARDLYQKNHNLPRKQLIELMMKELNTTENSVRTHISNASKELNASLGKAYSTRNTVKPTLKKEQAKLIVQTNYASMTRKQLAEKLVDDLSLKSINSAQTHISRIVKELGLPKTELANP